MIEFLEGISAQVSLIAPKIYVGFLIFLIFWLLAIILSKATLLIGQRAGVHKNILTLLGRIVRIVLIILGLITALGTAGINVSALVASLGLTGFALGFALKDALSNILAGILVLIYRPFECGDKVNVSGFEGKVLEIDLRYTTLQNDEKKILIPNSNLFNNPVVISEQRNQ